MAIARREFVWTLGRAAAGVAVAIGAPVLGACSSSEKGPPRDASTAKREIARAVFGPELSADGQRLMDRGRLGAEAREDLDALLAAARSGAKIDHDLIAGHDKAVRKLLEAFWRDEEKVWKAVGFPHGPGTCTTMDLYARPPAEARHNRSPFPRRGRGGSGGDDEDEA